jgi:hypothetical protein
MSNGSSVLDESASTLFAYAAPEIERSKVPFEEIRVYRSFDGNDMQGDQMLLFEKLSAGLFDDVIMMGLCIHTMVLWKMRRGATKDGESKRRDVLGTGKVVSRAIESRRHGTAQVAAGQYGAQCTVAEGEVGIED